MQLFALLLITVLDYVSSDPAHCYVTFMDSKLDNPYVEVNVDEGYYVESFDILKELTNDDGLKLFWDVVDQQAIDTDEESMDLCNSSPSDAEAAHLEILRQSLGLDSMSCPIKPTTINSPPTLFNCEYDFGDTEDSAAFLDYWIQQGDDHICDVSVSVLKPADDHTSEEK